MSNAYSNLRREQFLARQRVSDDRAFNARIDRVAARVTTKNRTPAQERARARRKVVVA